MKKFTSFLAVILSLVVYLSGASPALAQQSPQPPSRGIVTFYITPEQHALGLNIYKQLKYDLALPNPDTSAILPENLSDFPAAYKQVLAQNQQNNGINGSFTEAWFDLQASTPVSPRTNTLFTVNAPLNGRIYSVVAGLPVANQCPQKIKQTEIAFFDNVRDAERSADELDRKGYLVYVSPKDDLTVKAFSQIFYDQTNGKKQANSSCLLVSGTTENLRADFRQIFYLLPPALQMEAKQQPFDFFPRVGTYIYVANAVKNLSEPNKISMK
ncbi:hypothetical protein H6G33_30840 [Calothrix sp. FACHB-1219]|uniref:hypothetical protein n=1 Tax=unclassified Calothrix TaxID=2619626 RepID=UPI00168329D3|nr:MULTISPECIES: hypothetical protein [unclassified Calothrix]MBD2206576.1 hypothetical protein [Calothrix sp. FACHB-168]MBD2221371.1 hypothetical protein [Calothrix sp. FACHB-1219]